MIRMTMWSTVAALVVCAWWYGMNLSGPGGADRAAPTLARPAAERATTAIRGTPPTVDDRGDHGRVSEELPVTRPVSPVRRTDATCPAPSLRVALPTTCPAPKFAAVDDTDTDVDRQSTWIRKKYEWYATKCKAKKAMMWSHLNKDTHDLIATTVAEYFGFKKGSVVFDWACGCGVSLAYFADKYKVRGLGVDLVGDAIAFAKKDMARDGVLYCHGDGTELDWIPSNSVEYITAFGAFLHLNSKNACKTIDQLLRILVPGGKMWAGYIDNASTRRMITDCTPLLDPCHNATQIAVYENKWFKGFGVPKSNRKLKPYSLIWGKGVQLVPPVDPTSK